MQVVIKISEDDYKEVKEDTYSGTPFENRIFSAIANGIPLPEKYGDLIDRDELLKNDIGKIMGFRENDIRNAPIILKAQDGDTE